MRFASLWSENALESEHPREKERLGGGKTQIALQNRTCKWTFRGKVWVSLAIFKTKIFFMAAFFQGWVFSIETSFFFNSEENPKPGTKISSLQKIVSDVWGPSEAVPFPGMRSLQSRKWNREDKVEFSGGILPSKLQQGHLNYKMTT
jgi:hypothetical protein